MEAWICRVHRGSSEAGGICSAIGIAASSSRRSRHYAQDYDDSWTSSRACASPCARNDLRTPSRVRGANGPPCPVLHVARQRRPQLTIDWFRHRDGRIASLSSPRVGSLQRLHLRARVLDRRSHVEEYELIPRPRTPLWSFRQFLSALRETYAS